jgi:AraC family cel operon transcriptional repressor
MIKLQKNEVNISDYNPVNIQDTTFFPNQIFQEHSHDFFELFIILEGEMFHKLNGASMTLTAGSICFIRPDDFHTVGNHSSTDNLHIINIIFSREMFADTLLFFNNSVKFNPDDHSGLIADSSDNERKLLMEKVEQHRQFSIKPEYLPMKIITIKSLILDFLLMLYRRTAFYPVTAPEWLTAACSEMQKKENFTVGLPVFIKLAGKSQEHLTRYMKKYLNDTPQAFIIRLRIHEAARLLRNTRKTIDNIMYETGFNNVSYFRRCFCRQLGDPPGRYLRKSRSIFNPQH